MFRGVLFPRITLLSVPGALFPKITLLSVPGALFPRIKRPLAHTDHTYLVPSLECVELYRLSAHVMVAR